MSISFVHEFAPSALPLTPTHKLFCAYGRAVLESEFSIHPKVNLTFQKLRAQEGPGWLNTSDWLALMTYSEANRTDIGPRAAASQTLKLNDRGEGKGGGGWAQALLETRYMKLTTHFAPSTRPIWIQLAHQ